MTDDVELLPLPDWMECLGEVSAAHIRDYARANVEAKDAQIEALRAEASTAHEAVLYHIAEHAKTIARAEQLAEALRECRPFVAYAYDQGIVGADLAGLNLDAALHPTTQENT